MAAINFPDSPSINDEFTSLDGRTWIWTGVVWNSVETAAIEGPVGPTGPQGLQGVFLASETPPSSPSTGDIWFNTVTGSTYVYYDSFWVGASGGTAYETWSYVNSNTSALANQNFFADTSNGSFTIILPESPQIGEFVGIIDLENSFKRNGLVLSGGEELIEGRTDNMVLNVDRASIVIKFVGSTYGWRIV